MKLTKSTYFLPACLAFALCALLCLAATLSRPLFPVDETRYLTVAWEMHQSGNWILPTLNGEAYHHKPPVLFWLINLMWGIFGVSQQAAMVVPYLAAFSILLLTARLSTRLFPDSKNAPLVATALLGGILPFVIYSNLIMFDILLTVFVLVGITAIWDYFKTGKAIHLALFALAIGLGAITKGPVILLHLAPVIFAMKLWTSADTRPAAKQWVPMFLLALLAGVMIGLSWAIPAAIEGGKEFAEKIFYGQTAGRMVNAFDHKRPFFWYLTFIPLFVLPWMSAPSFWKAAKETLKEKSLVSKFLCVWIIPVFLAFCAISGKQVHYLVPLIPPLALLLTSFVLRLPEKLSNKDHLALSLTLILLALAPHLVQQASALMQSGDNEASYMASILSGLPLYILPPLALLSALAIWLSRRKTSLTLIATALSMATIMAGFQLAVKDNFFKTYDLTPVASFIEPLESHPMAFAGNYSGEFGFLAHRSKPIEEITRADIENWLTANPQGLVIVFDKVRNRDRYEAYNVLFEMPFRLNSTYMVLEAKGQIGVADGSLKPLQYGGIE